MAQRITTLVVVLALALGGLAPASARPTQTATEPAAPSANEAEAIAAAKAAAKEWLVLRDAWDWTGTWEQAGEMLQAMVDKRRWQRQMSVNMGPLGKVKSRAIRSAEYSTTMPGLPDGEYVTVIFDTAFENKQTAVETVPMMKEKDGTWRVSGYWLR